MRRLVSHEMWASFIGMLYLGLITNALLVIACLPLVVLLITTDPALSWPLLAVAAALGTPAVAAAFCAFREHAAGGRGPIRAFAAGLRDTWRRALLIGVGVVAVLVVLLVDVRAVSATAASVALVPILGVLSVLALGVGLLALVAIAEVPTAPMRDVLRACIYLGVCRWYLTAVSLLALGVQVAIFASAPAIGLGVTAAAILYLAWANSRFTLRPVLDLDEAIAV